MFGRVAGDRVTAGQAIESVYDLLPVQPLESVAVTVIGELPVCVGVPDSVPEAKAMPEGSVPVSDQVIAPTPPVCVKEVEGYPVPAVPEGTDDGEIVIVGQSMLIVPLLVHVTEPIEALKPQVYVPGDL